MTLAFFTSARSKIGARSCSSWSAGLRSTAVSQVDELLLHHVHGELQRGGGGALAVARLEHEQLAFLDGELDVLHVLEVLLEDRADLEQFGVGLRHLVLQLEDRLRGADAGDDVFALRVDRGIRRRTRWRRWRDCA
jgi:hypothetical protein